LSCLVLSCLVLSCLVLSLSCLVFVLSCLCLVLSCLVLSLFCPLVLTKCLCLFIVEKVTLALTLTLGKICLGFFWNRPSWGCFRRCPLTSCLVLEITFVFVFALIFAFVLSSSSSSSSRLACLVLVLVLVLVLSCLILPCLALSYLVLSCPVSCAAVFSLSSDAWADPNPNPNPAGIVSYRRTLQTQKVLYVLFLIGPLFLLFRGPFLIRRTVTFVSPLLSHSPFRPYFLLRPLFIPSCGPFVSFFSLFLCFLFLIGYMSYYY
jgi:hypothetical protein